MLTKKLFAVFSFLFILSYSFSQKIELVKDINPDGHSLPNNFHEFKGKLYFEAAFELWVTDGTEEGTKKVKLPLPNDQGDSRFTRRIFEFDEKLFITAIDTVYGQELWVLEEEEEGFELFIDLTPGEEGSFFADMVEFKGELYIWANHKIWVSDGTGPGSDHLYDLKSSNSRFWVHGDNLYLNADTEEYGKELWVTDGTAEGLDLVMDIKPGPANSSPSFLLNYNDRAHFYALTEPNGWKLWSTDGTEAGTRQESDYLPMPPYHSRDFFNYQDRLYFNGRDSTSDFETWVTDGTPEGTHQFIIDEITEKPSLTTNFTEFNGSLYFFSIDLGGSPYDLWVTAGSPESTQKVSHFPDEGFYGYPDFLTDFNGRLYFFASGMDSGCQNWVSDGTTEGTHEIQPPDSIDHYCPYYVTEEWEPTDCFNGYGQLGNSLFFASNYNQASTGCELYKISLPPAENYQANECGEINYLLYPNPSRGEAKLLLETISPFVVSVRVFDMAGRLVEYLAKEKQLEPGAHEILVNSSSTYAQGLYLLEISNGTCKEWLKLNIVY